MIIHILLLFYCFNSIDCSLSKNKNVTLKTHIQNAKFQVNYNQFKINNDLEYIFIFNSTEVYNYKYYNLFIILIIFVLVL